MTKRKRNRLTDLRCAWKHATDEEREAFLVDVATCAFVDEVVRHAIRGALDRVKAEQLDASIRGTSC